MVCCYGRFEGRGHDVDVALALHLFTYLIANERSWFKYGLLSSPKGRHNIQGIHAAISKPPDHVSIRSPFHVDFRLIDRKNGPPS